MDPLPPGKKSFYRKAERSYGRAEVALAVIAVLVVVLAVALVALLAGASMPQNAPSEPFLITKTLLGPEAQTRFEVDNADPLAHESFASNVSPGRTEIAESDERDVGSICGNDVVEEGETSESCCEDAGCSEGLSCSAGRCV